MTEIGQKLIAGVRAAAEANPDFVYESPPKADPLDWGDCAYVYDGKPSCIVGHAAWNAGLIDTAIQDDGANEGGIISLEDYLHVELDPSERSWLTQAQNEQDNQKSWSDAVASADAKEAA